MSENIDSNPPGDNRRDEQLDSVIANYIRASEEGDSVDRQSLLEQFPELAAELEQFFDQRDRLNLLADPIREFGDDLFKSVGPGRQLSYVGNYDLLEEIARGGMGVVYKARQTTLGRIVAVKMIVAGRLASEQDVQRFQVEAQAAAGLQHPNIVSIHEVGQHEGWHYFSMDYVEGRDLSSVLRENLLSARQAATYVRQMAEAIHYAHRQGILHRDLKPSNIMIDSHDQVRITDFGLAVRVEGGSELTHTGQILGTPSYMPPEQAQGKRSLIGPGSDVYSLGAVLYECLTGRAPFRAESVLKTIEQVIHAEAASPRTLNAAIPRDLETICLKCLEKEPQRRYGTAQLLADDLQRFLAGEPIVARPLRQWERGVKWVRRHPAHAALTLVSFVATLAIAMTFVSRAYIASLKTFNASLEKVNTNLESATAELQITLRAVQVEKTEADLQRARAKDAEAKARRYLYAAQMVQIEKARQEKQPERVVQLLRSVIPEYEDQEDPRGFEWYHLWRLYHGEQSRLHGHKGAVRAVAFSPDDRLLASAGDDTTIKLWDTTTGKERLTLHGHTAGVTGLSFNSTGSQLASCSADGKVKVWDVASRRELLSLDGHEAAVTCVTFCPDDRHIASGSKDKTVRVWDTTGGALVKMKTFDGDTSGVAFSPDGKQLACVTRHEQVSGVLSPSLILWEPFTTKEVTLFGVGENSSQSSVSFSPDGSMIATAEDAIKYGKGKPRVSLRKGGGQHSPISVGEHERNITQVAFSPDGQRLATSCLDQSVKVWDIANTKEIATLHEESSVYSVCFSPDSKRLASGSGDGTVKIWSLLGTEDESRTLQTGNVNNVVFSPDGKRVAGVSKSMGVWDVCTGREIHQLRGGQYSRAQWSPDGRFLACGTNSIWNTVTGEAHGPFLRHGSLPSKSNKDYHKVAFTKDSELLAVAGHGTVQVFDMLTGELERNFPTPTNFMAMFCSCVAISPDNKLLAAGSGSDSRGASGKVKIWNLESGTDGVAPEEAFYLSVWDLAFSSDGTQIAAAIGDYKSGTKSTVPGEVVVWDARTGVARYRLQGHRSCVWAVTFSPDGKRLASASGNWRRDTKFEGEVKMWDLTTGQEICTFPGHSGTVYGVAFSPCGRRLATGSADGTIKIWDGTPLAETPRFEPLPDEK